MSLVQSAADHYRQAHTEVQYAEGLIDETESGDDANRELVPELLAQAHVHLACAQVHATLATCAPQVFAEAFENDMRQREAAERFEREVLDIGPRVD